MLRQRARTLQAVIAASDAAATCAAFFLAYYFIGIASQEWMGFREILPLSRYLWLLYVSVPLWLILLALFGCYDLSPLERIRDNLRRMAWPLLMGAAAIGAAVFFSKELLFSRRVVGAFAVGNVLLLLAGRTIVLSIAPAFYQTSGALRRILILGTGEAARQFGDMVRQAWGLSLEGYISAKEGPFSTDCLGAASELSAIIDERAIDDVVMVEASGEPGFVGNVIRQCEEVGVRLHIPSEFFQAVLSRPHLESFRGIPMLSFSPVPYNPLALGIKRMMDIVLSLILFILFAIPMIVMAIIIKATSPGPVLFKQRRSGLYGRPFMMYKFRTMVQDAEKLRESLEEKNEMAGPVFKMREDPRVTRFGRWLRRHSLDELPQLWNVMKGDMGIVGPRPPLPDEVQKYERWQRRRLSMRPGLTCIWQVTDRNTATFDRWMEYDLQYIDHWSLWLDFKLLFWTVFAVIRGTGI